MKNLRMFCTGLILLFALSQVSIAQTKHFDLHGTCNDYVFCLNKVLTGTWTYNFSYHVDKKTGVLTRIHFNVKQCDLVDSEGNKYRIIDTGTDNLGLNWDFFNYLGLYNEGYDIYYDHEDGFLDEYMPGDGEWPTEGTIPWTFMIIGNGEKVTYKSLLKAYTDENGDLIFKIERYKIDCN